VGIAGGSWSGELDIRANYIHDGSLFCCLRTVLGLGVPALQVGFSFLSFYLSHLEYLCQGS
jgi:hypothetical protein